MRGEGVGCHPIPGLTPEDTCPTCLPPTKGLSPLTGPPECRIADGSGILWVKRLHSLSALILIRFSLICLTLFFLFQEGRGGNVPYKTQTWTKTSKCTFYNFSRSHSPKIVCRLIVFQSINASKVTFIFNVFFKWRSLPWYLFWHSVVVHESREWYALVRSGEIVLHVFLSDLKCIKRYHS